MNLFMHYLHLYIPYKQHFTIMLALQKMQYCYTVKNEWLKSTSWVGLTCKIKVILTLA